MKKEKMSFGPLELLIISFPGNKFKGEIIPEIQQMVEDSIIRVIDLVLVLKDKKGEVHIIELNDLEGREFAEFDPIATDITGLLSEDDIRQFASALENNSSAAMMLFEDTWAKRFGTAVLRAGGEVIMSERIPNKVVKEMMTELAKV